MKILVNGREAVLKANASFEYVSENPLFTEAEDYTMEIPFPMKDCPQNISIFGPLHVKGVDISKVSFPCEIQTDAFVKSGILTITSVSDTEVKGQFLEGMSQQNFASSLPDVYLTDLDFSQYDGTKGGWSYDGSSFLPGSGPSYGWTEFPIVDGDGQIQDPVYYEFGENCAIVTRHIYLSHLIDLVGIALGWTIDINELRDVRSFPFMVVANCRLHEPLKDYDAVYQTRSLNMSLPHWTVKEFLDQIALFFGMIYQIFPKEKRVKFVSYGMVANERMQSIPVDVLDNFEIELRDEDPQFKPSKKIKYPDDCNPDNINCCPKATEDIRIPHTSMDSYLFLRHIDAAANEYQEYADSLFPAYLYYLTDLKEWAILTKTEELKNEDDIRIAVFQTAEIINQYGDQTDGVEVKIAPIPIGLPANNPKSGLLQSYPIVDMPKDILEPDWIDDGATLANAFDLFKEGVPDVKAIYFDRLWLVCYDEGLVNTRRYEQQIACSTFFDKEGNPLLSDDKNRFLWTFRKCNYYFAPGYFEVNEQVFKVDETKLYRYKFLAKTLPSPTSVFLIKGKRYACLKLTAQITVKGMSELVEGEFYEIID